MPTTVSWRLDATGDGIIDENDVMYILRRVDNNNYPTPCPPTMICAADVNFDCHIDRDDSAAVLEAMSACHQSPCPCGEEGGSMAGFAGGAGLSFDAFADAIMAQDPPLTEAQIDLGWECFLEVLASD